MFKEYFFLLQEHSAHNLNISYSAQAGCPQGHIVDRVGEHLVSLREERLMIRRSSREEWFQDETNLQKAINRTVTQEHPTTDGSSAKAALSGISVVTGRTRLT